MGAARKILGQAIPAATTLTALYTVPASGSTVCSTLCVCNQSTTQTTFRVSVAISGATDTPAQYLYYDVVINGKDTFMATIGITLFAGDIIRVYVGTANVSFNVFGEETTP